MKCYFDHNATSPVTVEHFRKLEKFVEAGIGNPSSAHGVGRNASVLLSSARKSVAAALSQFDVSEIVFTSGATEANNMATLGVVRSRDVPIEKQHAVISSIEHPSVAQPIEYLAKNHGLSVTLVRVDEWGRFQVEDVIKCLRNNTSVVALMAANNELGICEPVKEFADWLHTKRWQKKEPAQKNPFDEFLDPAVTLTDLQNLHFHVDAVQAFGKLQPKEWMSAGMDSVSLSAHKLGALSGVGVLALRRGRKYEPLFWGGAQEKKRRGGTENILGIASFGLVCDELSGTVHWNQIAEMNLRRMRLKSLLEKIGDLKCNTSELNCLPNTLHYTSTKRRGEDVLMHLDLAGISASSGSACSSGANLPSQIVLALGQSEVQAKNAIRFSLGTATTDADVDFLAQTLAALPTP